MSTTDNLGLTLIDVNQSQKEVTANEAFSALDAALCDTMAVDVLDGTNAVAAATVQENAHLYLVAGSPAPTTTLTVELPAVKRLLVITNGCGELAEVACAGAGSPPTTVEVPNGTTALVYCDGAEVYGVAGVGGAEAPVGFGGWIAGTPAASEIVFSMYAVFPFELAVDFAGAGAESDIAATATTDFDVQKNGVSIGTMSFAAAGTAATYTAASGATFAIGDIMRLVAPATPDATLADISFTFKGTRL